MGQNADKVPIELLGRYLNDHLAGATAGCDLAEQIEAAQVGTPLGRAMSVLVADIKADRDTLKALMEEVDVDKSLLMQLEMLCIGVEGKLALWKALQAVFPSGSGEVGVISQPSGIVDVDLLVGRAQDQIERLEGHRLRAAIDAFGADPAAG